MDDELAEFQRRADIAAKHSARHRALLEEWLADPGRDPAKLREADIERALYDEAFADVVALIERAQRRRLP